MPINTFLKTPQSDFATTAESFRVLCKPMHHSRRTRAMQYVRKALTVLVLLFGSTRAPVHQHWSPGLRVY